MLESSVDTEDWSWVCRASIYPNGMTNLSSILYQVYLISDEKIYSLHEANLFILPNPYI